jgi:hypothetical protein
VAIYGDTRQKASDTRQKGKRKTFLEVFFCKICLRSKLEKDNNKNSKVDPDATLR